MFHNHNPENVTVVPHTLGPEIFIARSLADTCPPQVRIRIRERRRRRFLDQALLVIVVNSSSEDFSVKVAGTQQPSPIVSQFDEESELEHTLRTPSLHSLSIRGAGG